MQRWQDIVRPWDSEHWAGAFYPFGTRAANFQEPELVSAVLKNGWPSTESATASLLELDKQRIYSQNISVFFYVEMPAQIKVIQTDNQSCAIHVKAEENMRGLALYWDTHADEEVPKKLRLHEVGHDNGFQLLSTETIPIPTQDNGSFSCWLSHESVPVIDTTSGRLGKNHTASTQINAEDLSDLFYKLEVKSSNTLITEKKIFVSHINEEASLATSLKQNIEKSFSGQCSVFVSSHPMDLPAGTRWLEEISDALESASILIVLCSPSSIGRPWINFEAGCCWNRKIPIVPVCHSGQRRNNLPPPLSSFQSLELEDETFSKDLVHALGAHLTIKPTSEFDYRRMNNELVETTLSNQKHAGRERSHPPQYKDGALELSRVLERQELRERTGRILRQVRPSPLIIEFDGENSAEWVERPHPALPMQRVRNKVYGVVIYNSTNRDVDNVTVEVERIDNLTDQSLEKWQDAPYLGQKLSFERNGKTTMKFSPDLRDRVRLISHGSGLMMADTFHIEDNENYSLNAQHRHRIHLKVTGDGVKPSKATFIAQLDKEGTFRMVRDEESPLS